MWIIKRVNITTGETMYLHIVSGTDERVYVGDRSAAEVYMERIDAIVSYRLAITCNADNVIICLMMHTSNGWVRYSGTDHDMHCEVQELSSL